MEEFTVVSLQVTCTLQHHFYYLCRIKSLQIFSKIVCAIFEIFDRLVLDFSKIGDPYSACFNKNSKGLTVWSIKTLKL